MTNRSNVCGTVQRLESVCDPLPLESAMANQYISVYCVLQLSGGIASMMLRPSPLRFVAVA